MVYFEQRVVLPLETQERVDRTLQLLNAIYWKINEISNANTTAAIETVKSAERAFVAIEKTVANATPGFQRVNLLISELSNVLFSEIGNLSIMVVLLLLLLGFLAMTNTVLCYLVWRNESHRKCRCKINKTKKLD